MISRRPVRRATVVALFFLSALSPILAAHADDYDFTFGSDARAFAMGGVGLAITRNQTSEQQHYNPASLSFNRKSFALYTPSVSIRTDGAATTGKIYDYVTNGVTAGNAANLIREFTTSDSVFGASANAGFQVGAFEFLLGATAKGRLLPNQPLQDWANSGGNGNPPLNAEGDLIAAGYATLPSVAYAIKLPMGAAKDDPKKGYDASVGLRVKVIRTYYARYYANATVLGSGNADAYKAPEMNGKDYLDKTGVGADLGFLFKPKVGKGINYALVINNLVNPSSKFTASNVGIANYQGLITNGEQFNLLQTTVSVGTAYEAGGLTLGADLMDISSATRPVDFRVGGEQKIGPILALRGGYSSNTGLTFGAGIFGFDFAFAQRLPLEVNKTIKF